VAVPLAYYTPGVVCLDYLCFDLAIHIAGVFGRMLPSISLVLLIILTPAWRFSELWPLLIVAVFIPILVFVRHRENISRLLSGTESKVFQKTKTQKAVSES
jgi:glycerol-3-phosphate acyltransferase PlsY